VARVRWAIRDRGREGVTLRGQDDPGGCGVRAALPEDWPAIWQFMRRIVAAGETFSWEQEISEAEARRRWFHDEPPGRTFVAVDADGTIGSAESEPNSCARVCGPRIGDIGAWLSGIGVGPFGKAVGCRLTNGELFQHRT
jgi:hypothetical protein